ncbi:MAG: glucokinase [Pseudomonadota bacterium]
MMTDYALVADIGGTNARFALAERNENAISVKDVRSFRAEDFKTIRDAADAYLEAVGVKPVIACFAVAGPVTYASVEFTNSPWVLEIEETEKALGLKHLAVMNDFEALASSVQYLRGDDLVLVKAGPGDSDAPKLVIGPGTGLGQALIVPCEERDRIIATEGGHVSFAPRTDKEFEVMKFIAREHPHVSVERLLSGSGLVNIYRALCAIREIPRASLQANEITAAAIDGSHPIAAEAVNMFCAVLGRVAGDAVLSTGARGGVFLGGGILPKIKDIFLKSDFADCFHDKGRMRDYLEDVPVQLIVRDGAALLGAASGLVSEDL